MLEYLKEFNFKDEEIQNIIETNDFNVIKNLELMKKNVKAVINYFYDLGVEDVFNIFKMRIDLFLLPLSLIEQNFTKLDKDMLLYILNNSVSDLINYNIWDFYSLFLM